MLDEYSLDQRAKLAVRRPDWIPYVSEFPYEGKNESYLLVEIPSPGNPEKALFLYTADNEVTVAFGVWEWHYPNPSQPEQDALEVAVAEVEKIQKDKLVVVSYWQGEQWLGSRAITPDEPLTTPGFAVGAKRAKVLSWSGRLSREVAL